MYQYGLVAFAIAASAGAQTADLEGAWTVTLLDPPKPTVQRRLVFPKATLHRGRSRVVLDGQCWDVSVSKYRLSGFVYEAPCRQPSEAIPVVSVTGVRDSVPAEGTLAGVWEGSQSGGMPPNASPEPFRMEITESQNVWTGKYTDRGKAQPVRKITRTGPRNFRFEAGGSCWNVEILADEFNGLANGGPCGASGLGPAAQLNVVSARRTR